MSAAFDAVLQGRATVLEHDNGTTTQLQVRRWFADPDDLDARLVRRCRGSTLDVGCGPGRFVRALALRGVPVLGIDTSPEAVRLTTGPGCRAMLGSVFDDVPDEGQWQHVLLADGNIGIGGNPVELLGRVRALLRQGGTALIETGAPGTGLRTGSARLRRGPWFPWAELDTDTLRRLGEAAGFALIWTAQDRHRWFAELSRG